MSESSSPWHATHTAGAAISRVPLVFSHDSTRLFATSLPGHTTAHSVATARRLTSVRVDPHDAAYVHLALNPRNRTQLVAVGGDGVVRSVDTDDGALLRTARTHTHAVVAAALHPTRADCLVLAARNSDDEAVRILWMELNPSEANESTTNDAGLASDVASSRTLLVLKACHALDWSADGRHLVVLGGRKHLSLVDTALLTPGGGPDEAAAAVRTFHLKIAATVLAVSPAVADGAVAVGDVSGRITLFRCLSDDTCRKPLDKCVSTTLHWHAHGVNALAFNADGDYLYSGGEEGVLVSWQLRSGARSFLPRLGAAIVDIALSPDAKFMAIAVALNNVAIVDVAASRVVRRINGLRVAVPPDVTEVAQAAHTEASKASKTRLELYKRKKKYQLYNKGFTDEQVAAAEHEVLEAAAASASRRHSAAKPRRAAAGLQVVDGVCVLNGGPNTLQFFDVLDDRHVAELEVARGKTTSHMFASAKVFTDAVVEHVAFSPDRLTLVTVDRRTGVGNAAAADMQLKFWARADTAAEFQLHTRVEHAHRGAVTRLLYHPTAPLVVTASADGRVRSWMRRDAAPPRDQPQHLTGAAARTAAKLGAWSCRSTAEHRRGIAAADADLCRDGSLLAVAYGASVTLWAPFRVVLLRTLTYPSREQPPLTCVRFLAAAPLLATTTESELHFWDLTSGLVVQSFRIGLAQIAVHPSLPLLVGVAKLSAYGGSGAAANAPLTSSALDEDVDAAADAAESDKRTLPLAAQHVLLFEPTKRALPQCIYRTIVGFNRRQRRREVQSPDALITQIAFADAQPKVTANALFALSRGGILSCLQPADAAPSVQRPVAEPVPSLAAPGPFAVPLPQSTTRGRVAGGGEDDDDDDNPLAKLALDDDDDDDDASPLASSVARMSSAISHSAALERVFDGPTHAVPPLSALAESYLGALLRNGAPPPPAAPETVLDMDESNSNTSEPLLLERVAFDVDAVEDTSAAVEPQECFEAFRVFFEKQQK